MILVGDYPPSQMYVKRKEESSKAIGIHSVVHRLSHSTTTESVCALIKSLNEDSSVNAILVQLPLPNHIHQQSVIETISPLKDVDGLTAHNLGRLLQGSPTIVPCTPQGCMQLIKSVTSDLMGLNALVIGRSTLVGKPIGQLLLNENTTVTHAHSYTPNLDELTLNADIIVAAAGVPGLVKHVKQGSIIIDVGITRQDEGVMGDVDFEAAKGMAKAITPVPGGVGPMTVANLLLNTLKCFELQN